MEKARRIINAQNITEDILESIKHTFPYGFDEDDCIKFVNAAGDTISALPIETEDARLLIKIGVEMNKKIDAFLEEDDEVRNNDEDFTPDAAMEADDE